MQKYFWEGNVYMYLQEQILNTDGIFFYLLLENKPKILRLQRF